MSHVIEWMCIVHVLLLGERYIWWDPEMSHADVIVCYGDQQPEAGPSFSDYGRLKLCSSASNVLTNRSTE